jgi:oxalate decarboxylase/phosphoglucose isomerase-like protein (cupin superfamily)
MRLIERITLIPRRLIADERGWFLKVIDGTEPGLPPRTGEVYLTHAIPGQARGDHYHPASAEWFTLIAGQARLLVADPASGERAEFALTADAPLTVHVPAGLAHVFVNDGAVPFLLLAYAENLYDPADTVPFAVPRGPIA